MENATETTEVFTLLAVIELYGHSTSQSNTTAIGFNGNRHASPPTGAQWNTSCSSYTDGHSATVMHIIHPSLLLLF